MCGGTKGSQKGRFLVARRSGESRCRSFEKRVDKSSTWLSAGDLQSPPSFLKPGQSRLAFAFRASIYVGATVNSTSPFSSTLIVFSSPCRLSRATPRARCGEPSISRGGSIRIRFDRLFPSIVKWRKWNNGDVKANVYIHIYMCDGKFRVCIFVD